MLQEDFKDLLYLQGPLQHRRSLAEDPPQQSKPATDAYKQLARQVDERGPLFADVVDGNNNYVWDDNSEYFGEWERGQAHGRGVFSWPNGEPSLSSSELITDRKNAMKMLSKALMRLGNAQSRL